MRAGFSAKSLDMTVGAILGPYAVAVKTNLSGRPGESFIIHVGVGSSRMTSYATYLSYQNVGLVVNPNIP